MIVHFTLPGYGAPFLRIAADFEREHGVPVLTVLSTRLERSGPRAAVRRLRSRLSGADGLGGPRGRRGRVVRTADVNGAEVAEAIPAGSRGIITHFDQILRPPLLAQFGEIVNFHASLLPAYPGRFPTREAVAAGETFSGFSIHDVGERVDEGPIRYQERFAVPPGGVPALDALMTERMLPVFARWLALAGSGAPWPAAAVAAEGTEAPG